MPRSRPPSDASVPNGGPRSTDSGLRRKALALALFLILAASVLNAFFGERGVLGLIEARKDYQELVHEIERLERANQELAAEIELLRSDPLTIERLAREVLGMARPGEIVVEILDHDSRR